MFTLNGEFIITSEENDKDKEKIAKEDIIEICNSILQESGLLTTVTGFIFGFLLNISLTPPKNKMK